MAASKSEMKQLKTPLKRHNNLASLMMEIMPEEYQKMMDEETESGILTEDSLEAIYGDGMRQVKYRIELNQSFQGLIRERYSKDSRKADM